MRPYDAREVAEYIVWYCNQHNKPINNYRLNITLYYVQAQFLLAFGEPCFWNIIRAYDHGPIVPAVYQKYKSYAATNITGYEKEWPFTNDELEAINRTVDVASERSVETLQDIATNQDPWIAAYLDSYDDTITPESIKRFFVLHNSI